MLGRMSVRISAAKWSELVAAWDASGQSVSEFSSEHGVTESSLRWWRTEIARRARKEAARHSPGPGRRSALAVSLARVVRQGDEVAAVEPSGGQVSIVVGAVSIVVERGFDRQLLRDVVGALRERA